VTLVGQRVFGIALSYEDLIDQDELRNDPTDCLWARPGQVANKVRALELQAGMPTKKGNKRGPACAHNVKALRERETEVPRQAERAYEHFVSQWQTRRPAIGRTGAAKEERLSGSAADLASSSSALRHAVARAKQKYQTVRRRGLSISSVLWISAGSLGKLMKARTSASA
jgi:hypothetical protein